MKNLERMGILVVDDSHLSRAVIQKYLNNAGFANIFLAESGAEAIKILDSQEEKGGIDLVLMDIVMKDMTGIDACGKIKANKKYADIPVVMVTGVTNKEKLKEAFSIGAVDYITKPVSDIELHARVRSVLGLRREMEERKAREAQLVKTAKELQKANRELERLSSLDGLTGIANRRYLDSTLQKEWRRAKRHGGSISLMLIDLDHFKVYNDFYGHIEGDECLKRVAAALGGISRRGGDFPARYGGEEFAVVLPETDEADARELAETLRANIEGIEIPNERSVTSRFVTASVGVATMTPGKECEPLDLVKQADDALYEAKRSGRNMVVARVCAGGRGE